MKDLRKTEFIKMLEIAQVLFEERESLIMCDIPSLGSVTYYPKADKVQINRYNTWEEGGYEFVKNILGNPTKVIVQEATSLVKIKEVKSREELRDDFAGLAMSAMINAMYCKDVSENIDVLFEKMELVSKNAYWYADQMLKQREL